MTNPPLPHGLHPISEAPVKQGEFYGPCLLVAEDGWVYGEWDGDGWWDFSEDGYTEPRYFLLLGSPPS